MVKEKQKARKRRKKLDAFFVVVPKHQVRAKTPSFLADPRKITVVQLTTDVEKAGHYRDRSGAFRHIDRHKELKGKFWYRKIQKA